jgi:hypothetical protein
VTDLPISNPVEVGGFTVGGAAVPASGRVRVRREKHTEQKPLRREPLVVWFCVGTVLETCDYGDRHKIAYFARKVIFKTDETNRLYVQGSDQQADEPVWVDGRGEKYQHRSTVDFYGNSFWVRKSPDGESMFFYSSPKFPPSIKLARTLDGRGLTIKYRKIDAAAPDGRPWSEIPEKTRLKA